MSRNQQRILRVLVGVMVILGVLTSFYYFHKSPKVQLMGTLISHKETDEKVVALTFDDGPASLERTTEILDVLDRFGVKATFFLIGEAMERYPASAAEIVRRGHELANHSYSHSMMLFRSSEWLDNEISRTDRLIREAGHQGTIYFRPPYGKKFLSLPRYLAAHDRATITWDVDADGHAVEAHAIAQKVIGAFTSGSIILMHVMVGSRKGSRAALPLILEDIQQKGYTFLKLSELLEKR